MPQKTAIPAIIFLFLIGLPLSISAQENNPSETPIVDASIEKAPTSAEVMRARISKSKAMLAVRNFPAAIYELENIKKENTEPSVMRVVNVLLMHAYLELSDYPKAHALLKETLESKGSESPMDYLAVAGQVVSGARSQAERYKSLGLSINDRNLPTVATADIEGMRKTLELVIDQSKALSSDEKFGTNAAALLEESSSARGSLARDAYDAKQWKDQVTDAREEMIASRSVILSAMTPPPAEEKEAEVASSRITNAVPANTKKEDPAPAAKKPAEGNVAEKRPERRTIPLTDTKPAEDSVAKLTVPAPKKEQPGTSAGDVSKKQADVTSRPVRVISSAKRDDTVERDRSDEPNVKSALDNEDVADPKPAEESAGGPLTIGSLIGYATRRVSPIYPRQARTMRLTGVVTVKIVVDEDGTVSEIDEMNGPPMLTRAAGDAIRKWKFRPFTKDGQPVKATGFVSFNFDL